jgi:TldD protein
MYEDLADYSIEFLEKLGANYAEARLQESKHNDFLYKNGNIESISSSTNKGLGVRFLVNKKMSFFSTNNLEKEKLKRLIEKSFNAVNKSKISEEIGLSSEKAHSQTYKVKPKINFEDVSPQERIELMNDAYKLVQEAKIKTPGFFIEMNDLTQREYLVTNEGIKIDVSVPKVSMYYFITVQNGQKTLQRYWPWGAGRGFEAVKEWDIPNLVLGEAKALNNTLQNAKPLKDHVEEIVVAPQVTGIMVHESVGHPYEADRILGREAAQAGESFVTKDMLNTKIGTEIVKVVDDPTVENSYGYFLYDNEGVKTRRKFLIKNGMITEFLHNRETAHEMGLDASNGSSRAVSFDRESIVRMSNTFLLPGDHTEEELIEGVKDGVYIKNFTEWNIDDKRLNQKYVGSEAYSIKNGKIGAPVLNPAIEVSTPKLWSSVSAIGNNSELHAGNCGKGEPMQGIPVTMGGPSMLLKGLKVR